MVSCGVCGKWFATSRARDQHTEAKGHQEEYKCKLCYDVFGDEEEREDHHVYNHLYCSDCERHFQNPNNIKMHLNSRTHRSQNIKCLFCVNTFTTATGVTTHLESGGCPNAPGLNRDDVYRLIRGKDPNGTISKNLIGWHGSETYEASDRTWNGSGYECYLCDRTFRQLAALNQHLKSPAHQQKLYHCPNRGCARDFKMLAALINHLESESCGFMRFDAVQRQMSDLVSSNRRIRF
ncbi:hypothetical protein B0T22DRAFT_461578 [Podospora appendiculata]|uniref:C2H2-type domain-containing protein n=1 Tax=Podospora appendiculata TaxID=314037 RepID=A0AAE1CDC9_9PEZI|nr:hypothetical protein B0T22DRAFT_461578 [Podospora appendiculata]